ncbi:MAG: hypothetical protein IJK84_04920 [Bacteroidales bacterium]|nr:hypothetical protein [Bacteroidales bacterium]
MFHFFYNYNPGSFTARQPAALPTLFPPTLRLAGLVGERCIGRNSTGIERKVELV